METVQGSKRWKRGHGRRTSEGFLSWWMKFRSFWTCYCFRRCLTKTNQIKTTWQKKVFRLFSFFMKSYFIYVGMDLSLRLYNPRSVLSLSLQARSLARSLSRSLSFSLTNTHKGLAINSLKMHPIPPSSHFPKPQLTALWFNWPQFHCGSIETNY